MFSPLGRIALYEDEFIAIKLTSPYPTRVTKMDGRGKVLEEVYVSVDGEVLSFAGIVFWLGGLLVK